VVEGRWAGPGADCTVFSLDLVDVNVQVVLLGALAVGPLEAA
jgi:hypothetical protein